MLLLGAPARNCSKFSRDTDRLVIGNLGDLLLFDLHFSVLFFIGLLDGAAYSSSQPCNRWVFRIVHDDVPILHNLVTSPARPPPFQASFYVTRFICLPQ